MKYRRWSLFTLTVGISAPVTLILALVAWMYLAGQAGSPQPDDWALKSRILDLIESSLLPLIRSCSLRSPSAPGDCPGSQPWPA